MKKDNMNSIKGVLKDIKNEILPKIKKKYSFIKDYDIRKAKTKRNYLGFYKNNSIIYNEGIAIIKLNMPIIREADNGINLDLYDILLTTILHELCHAIQNYNGNMGYYNETEAENFAYNYWETGQLMNIKKGG